MRETVPAFATACRLSQIVARAREAAARKAASVRADRQILPALLGLLLVVGLSRCVAAHPAPAPKPYHGEVAAPNHP